MSSHTLPSSSSPGPDGESSTTLAETWDQVKKGPRRPLDEKSAMADLEDKVSDLQSQSAPFSSLLTATFQAVDQTEPAKKVEESIDHFFEGMPVLMNALDAVVDLHPFIGVAVLAFKTVYTLELKRRDNEKKVIALYVEMKDMISVLLQPRDMRDEKIIAPDKLIIEDRLKTLVERTADDIKTCSNVCDTYAKKKLITKVFQGPAWDNKLLGLVSLFSNRRSEFEFALTVHMSQTVDATAAKVAFVEQSSKDINAKMEVMMALFQRLIGPEPGSISEFVEARGGARAFRNNIQLLKQLNSLASKDTGEHDVSFGSSPLETLEDELKEDPDTATNKNMIVFSRKFEVQKRQIIDELTLVVRRESDRIIKEGTQGAHDRVLDETIYTIWKELGWRGNVKARLFVLALRDHYVEEFGTDTSGVRGVSFNRVQEHHPDAWAIKFIDSCLNL